MLESFVRYLGGRKNVTQDNRKIEDISVRLKTCAVYKDVLNRLPIGHIGMD